MLALWTGREDHEGIFNFAATLAASHVQLQPERKKDAEGEAEVVQSVSWARLLGVLFEDGAAQIDPPRGAPKAEEDETALLLLGELAARSPALEAKAVFCACRIATASAELLSAAAAVLDDAAQQLGYASRFTYIYTLLPAIGRKCAPSLPLCLLPLLPVISPVRFSHLSPSGPPPAVLSLLCRHSR